ncbi:YbhB/YbcL family Raf kinase inhibitor-like protein [Duganella sp. S19_KUP01_CR8]|uniref:YbhB/YbcL family Raf kinase inhibitor-like protein n=1 Tax=Duganella sp. S19_KUP01_CR8 TaxID=3025502 RepID=UPI002FCDAB8C
MKLTSISFSNNQPIPGEFAFAVIAPDTHITLSSNRNPQLAWDEVPAGTQSFVLICHDPDVPSRGDDVNQEGREVPASLPRVDFFHWLLLDIPGATRAIAAGSHSDGVTPHGKTGPEAAGGMKHGINDYSNWFAGDAQMSGNYYGYDGPCPPWNDALLHHYVFTLYALDIPALPQDQALDGLAIRSAIAGHVLAEATLTGTYTLNPKLL